MPILEQEFYVAAAPEVVFDLSRSIDLHVASTSQTNERPVDGRTSGLLEFGEEVTWEARHLGITQRLSVRITRYDRPHSFRDSMLSGAFRRFDHDHLFAQEGEGTRVLDRFDYTSPLGPLGRLADVLFLKRYMARFLEARNAVIQRVAESSEVALYLDEPFSTGS